MLVRASNEAFKLMRAVEILKQSSWGHLGLLELCFLSHLGVMLGATGLVFLSHLGILGLLELSF